MVKEADVLNKGYLTPKEIEMAILAAHINQNIENIGARRLHTILEKLLEEIGFDASDREDKVIEISREHVQEKVGPLAKNQDLSKFIL